MPKGSLTMSSYETALILAQQHAIMRILTFTFTYLFWLYVILVALFLKLFGVVEVDFFQGTPKWLQFLSLIGITPFLLAVSSWKVFAFFCEKYVTYYRNAHTQSP